MFSGSAKVSHQVFLSVLCAFLRWYHGSVGR